MLLQSYVAVKRARHTPEFESRRFASPLIEHVAVGERGRRHLRAAHKILQNIFFLAATQIFKKILKKIRQGQAVLGSHRL